LVELGDLLKLRNQFIIIDDSMSYRRVTAKLQAKGIVLRDEIEGRLLKIKKQQLCKGGDFLVAEIDAKVGGFGIVPNELEGAIVSSHYFLFEVDEEQLQREYLGYFIRTQDFQKQICARGSTNYASIRPEKVLELKVPLPPLLEQHRIVQKVSEIIRGFDEINGLRKHLIKEARNRRCQSGEAGIKSASEADIIMRTIRNEIFGLKNPIRSVVSIEESGLFLNKETRNPEITEPNEDFLYLDISGVEGITGRILEIKKYKGYDAPSRARRVMRVGDVIISTVRPYLRSFTIVPPNLDNQICSTGFAVFTCPPGIEPSFLLHQFLSDFFVEQCIQKMQGGHYPAINVSKLRGCKILVPPKEKQLAITAFLDSLQVKAIELGKLQAETEREIEQLVPNILNRAFKGEL
jgi:type I restriction enzyme S subunit